jgi:hypothetical protein
MKKKVIIKFKRKYIYILVMKIADITKNYGDEKIEIKRYMVDAGNKEENKELRKRGNNTKSNKENGNKTVLSGVFDFKNKLTKYMFMPFEVLNEVFMPKTDYAIKDDVAIEKSITHRCSGQKNKRKCIKKAIRKTCRNKGTHRKKCKRTLKNKLLN